MKRSNVLVILATLAMCPSVSALFSSGSALGADEKAITYEDDVLPIFRNNCLVCHSTEKLKADLDLSVYSAILQRDVLAAGDPDDSLLYKLITHAEEPNMPQRQPKLSDPDIETIRGWIAGGLLEKSGAKAVARKKSRAVVALADAPVGRPDGPPCMPVDSLLEPVVRLTKPQTIQTLAFAPWAPLLAVGAPKQVLLYHGDTRELVGVLPFAEGLPYHVGFSRSGTLIFAAGGRGGHSGRAVVWEVKSGRRICEAGDETDAVLAADVSPDQTHIALGGAAKLAKIFSIATGEPVHEIKKHSEWITAIEYSPDGVLLATADRGGALYLWESQSRQLFHDLRGHKAGITALSWRDDGNVLASSSDDGEVILWNISDGNAMKKWRAHGPGTTDVAFGHDGRLVTSGRDRVVRTWQGDGKGIRTFNGLTDEATACGYSHDGKSIAGGDWAGQLRVFADGDGAVIAELAPTPPTLAERLISAETRVASAAKTLAERSQALAIADNAARDATAAMQQARASLATANATVAAARKRHDTALKIRDGTVDNHKHAEELLAMEKASVAAAEKTNPPDEQKLEQLRARVADAEALLAIQRPSLEKAQAVLAQTKQQLDDAMVQKDTHVKPFEAAKAVAGSAARAAKVAKQHADDAQRRLAAAEKQRSRWLAAQLNAERIAARDALETGEDRVFQQQQQIEAAKRVHDAGLAELAALEKQLSEAPAKLEQQQSVVNQADATIVDANRTLDDRVRTAEAKSALFEEARAFVAKVTARAAAEPDNQALQTASKLAAESAVALEQDGASAADAVREQESVIAGHEGLRAAAAKDAEDLQRELAALPPMVAAAKIAVAALGHALEKRQRALNEQQTAAGEARKKLAELTDAYGAAKIAAGH